MGDFRVRVQNDSTLLIEVVGAVVASDMKWKYRNEKEKKGCWKERRKKG